MMILRKVLQIGIALAILGFATPSMAAEILIVNSGNGVAKVSKKNVKKMLLGKTKKWKGGEKVVLGTLSGGAVHEAFIKKFAGKTAKQFTNFWRKMVFSGKGKMPKSFDSEEDLIAFVAEHDGALGYIDSATGHDAVKALTID